MFIAFLTGLTTKQSDYTYGLTLPGEFTKAVKFGHWVRVKLLRIKT